MTDKTLRDEIAIAALQGMLAKASWPADEAAIIAYRHADAMLERRND